MPTVLRLAGARVVVYLNDHAPAHVHVLDGGREAVFILNCPAGPVHLREAQGYTLAQANRIARELDAEIGRLCAAWEAVHGDR